MKKVLVLATLVAAVSAYSQGTVNFLTRDTANGVNTLIYYAPGGPVTATAGSTAAKPSPQTNIVSGGFNWGGVNAKAGLYGGPAGTAADQLVLLVPSVGFRTGAAAGYVDPGSDAQRILANVAPGAVAALQIRAWDAGVTGVDSYEAAKALAATRGVYLGTSILFEKTLGGVGNPPSQPASLANVPNFTLDYVPEPSIIGLGILGTLAGLMVFRRRS